MTTNDPQPLLEGLHLERRFGRGTQARRVLNDVSVAIDPGECLGVIGGSGSGKTTLVRILLGLQQQTSGTVRYRGHDVEGRRSGGYRLLRAESALVFQDPFDSLDPRWDVERIVGEPLALRRSQRRMFGPRAVDGPSDGQLARHGEDRTSHAGRRDAVLEALAQAGLEASSTLGRRPSQLSGGQAQRVAIARAIVTRPKLIVADEPMSAIDVSARLQVLQAFAAIRAARPDTTLIVVSHDLGIVQHLADRVMVLHDGSVVEQGPTARILEHPRQSYTRQLIRAASW